MKIGVTGGLGLLGSSVVREARDRGHEVVPIDRLAGDGVRQADITDAAGITAALAGLDAVVHTASLIDLHLGSPPSLERVNVDGAKNVVAACRQNGIPRLVHMSSAEVISGAEPLRGLTEAQASYPHEHLTHYGVTKQAGEEAVLQAADDQLGTCAMRTYGLFGPGDNTVVPLFLKAMPGKRQMFLGDLSAKTDVVFAPNLAHAMVLAAEQLEPGVDWSGTPFHVTDAEPMNMQRFLSELIAPLGYGTIERPRLPLTVAKGLARVAEAAYRITGAERLARPPLTTHKLLLSTSDYWLNADKVRRVLGYEPKYERVDAIDRTQAWLAAEFA